LVYTVPSTRRQSHEGEAAVAIWYSRPLADDCREHLRWRLPGRSSCRSAAFAPEFSRVGILAVPPAVCSRDARLFQTVTTGSNVPPFHLLATVWGRRAGAPSALNSRYCGFTAATGAVTSFHRLSVDSPSFRNLQHPLYTRLARMSPPAVTPCISSLEIQDESRPPPQTLLSVCPTRRAKNAP